MRRRRSGERVDLEPASLGEPSTTNMARDQILRVAHSLAVTDDHEPCAWRDPPFGRELPLERDRHFTNNTGCPPAGRASAAGNGPSSHQVLDESLELA